MQTFIFAYKEHVNNEKGFIIPIVLTANGYGR